MEPGTQITNWGGSNRLLGGLWAHSTDPRQREQLGCTQSFSLHQGLCSTAVLLLTARPVPPCPVTVSRCWLGNRFHTGDVRMSELQELGLRLGELGWLVPSRGCWSSGLSHEAAFSNCPPIYYLQHAKSQGYYTSLVFLGSNSTRPRAGTSSLPSCAARSRLIAFSN